MGTYSARRARVPLLIPEHSWEILLGDSPLDNFSRTPAEALAFTMPNPQDSISAARTETSAPAEGKIMRTSPGRLSQEQTTIGRLSSARLSNTITLIILALRSIRAAIAIWASI